MHDQSHPETPSSEHLTGKAATQERILQAAMSLFLDAGYEKTTMTRVAERAGVGRATVFWHFSDKKSLFREAFHRLIDPFRRSLEREFDGLPPLKRLQEQVAVYRDFVTARQQSIDAIIRWALGKQELRATVVTTLLDLHQRVAGALIQTMSEIVPKDVPPEPLAVGLLTLLDGNVILAMVDPSVERAETRAASIEAYVSMIPLREGIAR